MTAIASFNRISMYAVLWLAPALIALGWTRDIEEAVAVGLATVIGSIAGHLLFGRIGMISGALLGALLAAPEIALGMMVSFANGFGTMVSDLTSWIGSF